MTDIQPYLQKIVDRFANPSLQAAFKGFTKTWLIRAVDGTSATLTQEAVEKPDILVTMSTDILAGVMDKKINGTTAYMQRKIQVKGAMEDLMKLQKLML